MGATMKAMRVNSFGGPEMLSLEDIPVPEPGPGEVLIRVHAAAVNPVDNSARSGVVTHIIGDDPLPYTAGWDVSGTVAALGEGVTEFAEGDDVYGMPRFPVPAGTCAEFATAPVVDLARKPRNIDHNTAAGVPLAALTAWQALIDTAGLAVGQSALIHAAAGGVGHLAVQIARCRGASVIGTASAGNEEFVRGLGVDQFIDYTATNFEDELEDIDVQLVPFGADFRERCWGVMRRDGFLVSIKGPVPEEEAAAHGVNGAHILVYPSGAQLAEIGGLIEAGRVKPVVDTVYPLAELAAAHAHVAAGHSRGKVVIGISD